MKNYDRENLNFLLNASAEVLEDWYEKVGEDDHIYASELLSTYSKELKIKDKFNLVESVDLSHSYMTIDAEILLKRYRL